VRTGHEAIIGWMLDFWSGFIRIIKDSPDLDRALNIL